MSFKDLTVMELKSVAKKTGVSTDATKKADLIEALEAEGVTYEYYEEKFLADDVKPAVEPEPAPAKKSSAKTDDRVVLRLVTPWSTLQTDFGTATQASPFIIVDGKDVAAATASGDFRVATTEEVKQAYGL